MPSPAKKTPGIAKIDDGTEGRKLPFACVPLIGNFDIRAVIRHFVAQDLDIDSRVGVIRRVGDGGWTCVERLFLLPGQ